MNSKLGFVLAALTLLAGSLTVSTKALATCYTCTLAPPYVCVPAAQGHHGWTDCTDGPAPDEPCDVNWSTGCTGTGGAPVAMLTSRAMLFETDEATRIRLLSGQSIRVLKGKGGSFAKSSLEALCTDLGAQDLSYQGATFSVGDADAHPVLAFTDHGVHVVATPIGANRTRIQQYGGELAAREAVLEDGDLAFLSVDLPTGPAIVVLSTSELLPTAQQTQDLVNVQLNFRQQIIGWDEGMHLSMLAGQ